MDKFLIILPFAFGLFLSIASVEKTQCPQSDTQTIPVLRCGARRC